MIFIKLKHKRGVIIPTRLIVAGVMILIQISLLFYMLYSLSSRVIWSYAIIQFLSIILSIAIINSKSNPTYKISWIIFILLVPFIGVTAYLLWGNGRIFPHLRRRMQKSEAHYKNLLPQDEKEKNRLFYEDLSHARQALFLSGESEYPLYCRTTCEYLSPGEIFMPRLLSELRKAKKYIFIEFFILAEGEMWEEIKKVLKEKVTEGVEIKIIFDDFGSISRQSKGFIKELELDGIEVCAFNKIRPSVDMFMNNRDHRKIIVIDGRVAFTGGINIGDEYINKLERFGYWMDCAAVFSGDAVLSFAVMFMSMWTFITGEVLAGERYITAHKSAPDGFVLPYCDSPLNRRNPAEEIYMKIISTAQKYVYIATPYLIIDNTMLHNLSLAARSGIDVRIITPKKWDKWYVHPVTQQNYETLLESGVKIYEYTPGFIHSKLFLSDDCVATVGSINMDYRSFFTHFECGAWLCKSKAVLEIKKHFLSLFEQSEEIILEKWKKRPIIQKIKQRVLSIFAPFM